MKETGIVRKVDELGRLVIPKELRDTLDISEGEPLDIFVDENKVILHKYNPGCTICRSIEDLIRGPQGKPVCRSCLEK